MDIFFPGGIQLVLAIQSLGAWLEIPMKFFSFLGSEQFFLFILPALYWSVDTALGLRVGAVLLLNVGVNDIFKLALHAPRPYWFDPAVRPISAETSFGAPSGHAQLSAGVWGALAASIRKPWGWALAVALTFLIGFSRIYLGVHFLHDVVLGWALGALVLGVVLRVQEPLAHWLVKKTVLQQVGMALALSLMLVISGALAGEENRVAAGGHGARPFADAGDFWRIGAPGQFAARMDDKRHSGWGGAIARPGYAGRESYCGGGVVRPAGRVGVDEYARRIQR